MAVNVLTQSLACLACSKGASSELNELININSQESRNFRKISDNVV